MAKSFRRTLSVLLICSLLFCSLPAVASAESYLLGDLDKDESVTVSDVVELRQIIIRGDATANQLAVGDLDEDGMLTVSDVVGLRSMILSGDSVYLETPFGDLDAAYLITSKFSGKAICPSDVESGVGQWTDVGAESQLWKALPAGGGYYILQSAATGRVLTLGYSGDIKMFQMAEYTGADEQKVKFLPAGDGTYWYLTVKSAGDGFCMEIPFAGLTETAGRTDGWPLWLTDAADADNRKFSVQKAEALPATFDTEWAEGIYDTFMDQFKGDDGSGGAYFIGTPDFWKTAELTEMILDCYEATGEQKYLEDYEAFYRGFINAHGTNWASNKYNDDLMWMVISCCRAYQLTGETEYLDVAKENFDLVYARGYDELLGGGIYWTTDKDGKNACINGPAAIAACYLSEVYGPVYLEYAKSLYAWERSTLFNAAEGQVYDNIAADGTLSEACFTYNQGTFIGAAALLYRLTGNSAYRSDAKLAADYTVKTKYQNGCINDESGGDFDGFKGILVRWMYKYMDITGSTEYYDWLALNITTGWENRNNLGLVGTKWGSRSSGDELESAFSYGTYISLIMPSFATSAFWEDPPA